MINITFTGLDDLVGKLESEGFSERRIAATMATALTRTAVKLRDAEKQHLETVFDRPTPYTVRQLKYVAATANKLAAAVGFGVEAVQDANGNVIRYRDMGPDSTAAGQYLAPQMTGGSRRAKRLEVALRATGALPSGWLVVPGAGAALDAHGNVSRGQIIQVLSQLRIQLLAGSDRNMSTRDRSSAIAAQRRAGGRFFVVPPGSRIKPGIYQREFMGKNITPVFVFVRSAMYQARYDFYGHINDGANRLLPEEMSKAIGEQLQRLQSRAGG